MGPIAVCIDINQSFNFFFLLEYVFVKTRKSRDLDESVKHVATFFMSEVQLSAILGVKEGNSLSAPLLFQHLWLDFVERLRKQGNKMQSTMTQLALQSFDCLGVPVTH